LIVEGSYRDSGDFFRERPEELEDLGEDDIALGPHLEENISILESESKLVLFGKNCPQNHSIVLVLSLVVDLLGEGWRGRGCRWTVNGAGAS